MEQSPELNIYDWIRIQLYVARLDQSNDALNTSLLHKVVEIVPGVPPRMKAPSRSLNGMISGCPFLVLASGWPEGLSKDRYTHGEMIHAFNNPGDFESPAGAMVGACQIHAVRPTACKLYPLGRSGDWKPNAGHMQFEYFLSGGCDCPGPKHGNEKTWLEHLERGGFNKEESEDSANWSVKIKSLVIKNKDKLNSENLRTLAMLMFPTLTRGEPLPKPEDDHQFVAEAMSRMIHVIGIWFEEGTPVQPVDEMMAIPWHIIMHGPLK